MNTTNNKPVVEPYLFFNGNCEEALDFYRKSLGAEVLFMMRFKDSPEPASAMPPGAENKIMHAHFRIGATELMASDGCEFEKPKFEGFSLSIAVQTEAEADRAFAALAAGGEVQMPLTKTFWSPRFGMVRDKFGIGWMINTVDPNQPKP